ncbi:hypothetical protein NBRC10512_000026 [Rhodotorula toruloides]|uniref:RHTO0S04e06700g1_1 n=2 Tax=Rhodotorula toruloides TaxID=5286 RepID=A0A061APX1_RHOTO|nr:uncharacterized protein RHTO_02044 [Rhodotorula toruloides NP11]EMS21173.1 hypothetical protein RHTO_02044 [Rhodotorula toruloides NP11]CDR39581.1 RHTO0S04e06700g1_1 [Rhodotorula toruloides]
MNSYVVGPPQLSQPGPLAQAFSLPALDQAAEYLLASNPSTFDSVSAAALYLDSLRTPLPATSTSSTGFASDYDASLAFSYAVAEANDIRLDETRRFLVVGWTPPYKGHSIFADGDTSPTGAVVRALITTCVIQTGIPCVFIDAEPFAPSRATLEALHSSAQGPPNGWSWLPERKEMLSYKKCFFGLLRYEQATFSAILALGPVAGWYLDLPALAFDATSPFPGSAPFHTVSSFLAPHPRSQVHEDSVSATSRGLFIFVKGMFEALADAGISVPSPSLAWDTFREAYGKAGLLNGGELFQSLRQNGHPDLPGLDDNDYFAFELMTNHCNKLPRAFVHGGNGCGARFVVVPRRGADNCAKLYDLLPYNCTHCGRFVPLSDWETL